VGFNKLSLANTQNDSFDPFSFETKEGKIKVSVPRAQQERMRSTCFRNKEYRLAGNFFAWSRFYHFIQDSEVRLLLEQKLAVLLKEKNVNHTHRFTLELTRDVGWVSVVGIEELNESELTMCERRTLNKRSTALFLPDQIIDSPKTNLVTVIGNLRCLDSWIFIIQSVYPGEDAGELIGDMTNKKGLIWLHWSNPGEL